MRVFPLSLQALLLTVGVAAQAQDAGAPAPSPEAAPAVAAPCTGVADECLGLPAVAPGTNFFFLPIAPALAGAALLGAVASSGGDGTSTPDTAP